MQLGLGKTGLFRRSDRGCREPPRNGPWATVTGAAGRPRAVGRLASFAHQPLLDFNHVACFLSAVSVAFKVIDADVTFEMFIRFKTLHNPRERSAIPKAESSRPFFRFTRALCAVWFLVRFTRARAFTPATALGNSHCNRTGDGANERFVSMTTREFHLQVQMIAGISKRQNLNAVFYRKLLQNPAHMRFVFRVTKGKRALCLRRPQNKVIRFARR